jgi:hypothetical protein
MAMSNRSVESITVRCSSEKTRKVDDCYANGYAAGVAAAAAPLPAPRQARTRFFGPPTDRFRLAVQEAKIGPRQRHSARHARDDRQVHHRPEIAGAALTVRMILAVVLLATLFPSGRARPSVPADGMAASVRQWDGRLRGRGPGGQVRQSQSRRRIAVAGRSAAAFQARIMARTLPRHRPQTVPAPQDSPTLRVVVAPASIA